MNGKLTVGELIERTRDMLQLDHVAETGGLQRSLDHIAQRLGRRPTLLDPRARQRRRKSPQVEDLLARRV